MRACDSGLMALSSESGWPGCLFHQMESSRNCWGSGRIWKISVQVSGSEKVTSSGAIRKIGPYLR